MEDEDGNPWSHDICESGCDCSSIGFMLAAGRHVPGMARGMRFFGLVGQPRRGWGGTPAGEKS